jgi:predicted dehydrogenase
MSHRARITRRRFIQSALATAAAPTVLTRLAHAQTPPSERLTLGMIGVGNMGSAHRHSLVHNRDFQILAVCDVKRRHAEKAQQHIEETYAAERPDGRYRGCDVYNEYERILARNDIDAVLIATPDHWHAIIAIAACRAGKDVYCEKPLSLTIREANQMVTAARQYQTVFQTGSQQRSSANFRRACELVRSGYIGKLQRINVGIGGPSQHKVLPAEPIPDGLDWDRWLGPTPWYPYNSERCSGDYSGGFRLIRDYSGGMMTDWGAHHFDIAQWGLGMDGSGPSEIIPPGESEHGTLTYRYANGVEMLHGGANGVLFTGTDGWVEVNRGYLKTSPAALESQPLRPNDVHLYESPGHHEDWLRCVRARQRPICDVAIGASSATVCHLGNIAWWLGRKIRWDPIRHEIIGDAEAARWLDRPKRAPYRI